MVERSGRHRPALTGQGVFPRPAQNPLPIWIGVGGTPQSFVRAGMLGLPLMVAVIGGEPRRFAPLIDLYRRAGSQSGHTSEKLQVGLHVFGYVSDSVRSAADTIYPGWQQMMTTASRERGFSTPTRVHSTPPAARTAHSSWATPTPLPPSSAAYLSNSGAWTASRCR